MKRKRGKRMLEVDDFGAFHLRTERCRCWMQGIGLQPVHAILCSISFIIKCYYNYCEVVMRSQKSASKIDHGRRVRRTKPFVITLSLYTIIIVYQARSRAVGCGSSSALIIIMMGIQTAWWIDAKLCRRICVRALSLLRQHLQAVVFVSTYLAAGSIITATREAFRHQDSSVQPFKRLALPG